MAKAHPEATRTAQSTAVPKLEISMAAMSGSMMPHPEQAASLPETQASRGFPCYRPPTIAGKASFQGAGALRANVRAMPRMAAFLVFVWAGYAAGCGGSSGNVAQGGTSAGGAAANAAVAGVLGPPVVLSPTGLSLRTTATKQRLCEVKKCSEAVFRHGVQRGLESLPTGGPSDTRATGCRRTTRSEPAGHALTRAWHGT